MAKKHFDVEMLIFEKAQMKLSCFQDTHSLLATTCQVNEVWCVWTGTLPLTCWIWISLNTSKSFHTLHPWWRGDVHWWEITSWIIHTFRGHWWSSPGCLEFLLFTGRVEHDGWSMQKTNQKKPITFNRHLSFSTRHFLFLSCSKSAEKGQQSINFSWTLKLCVFVRGLCVLISM